MEMRENMKLEEIADHHNRRSNIALVAQRCREHRYPLLAWPEDEALLRLTDLPVIHGTPNRPVDWKDLEYTVARLIGTDEQLRDFIRVGRAYCIKDAIQHLTPRSKLVVEYMVETR
jgi:hypothetical protein